MKRILRVNKSDGAHWVGNGFPVQTLLFYERDGLMASPFLLLDYAGPMAFGPAQVPRGVGEHPHRGFETVTIVYQGEVAHRDSSGGGGMIGPGDVQWMTAGSGVVHDEFHSHAFTRSGGMLEMVQLWVNLPAQDKLTSPRYQTLRNGQIPSVSLPGEAGTLRVIAGAYAGQLGPAATFTPMDVWDIKLRSGASLTFAVDAGRSMLVAVLQGVVQLNGDTKVSPAQLGILASGEGAVRLDAVEEASVLVLSGEPLNEPIVGYGPFVMNTDAQIREAFDDFKRGEFGRLGISEIAGRAAQS